MGQDGRNAERRSRAYQIEQHLMRIGTECASEQQAAVDIMVNICHWWHENGSKAPSGDAPMVERLLTMVRIHYEEERAR